MVERINTGNAATGNPGLSIIGRATWNNLLPLFRKQGGEIFGGLATTAARPIVKDDEMAKRVGEMVDSTFQVSLSVSANVRDFTAVAKDSRKRLGALMEDVEPYLVEEFGKCSRSKLMRSKNEIISHERAKVMGQTKYDFFGAVSKLTDKLPDLFAMVDEKRMENKSKAAAAQAADNPIDEMKTKADAVLGNVASSSMFDPENRQLIDAAIRAGAPAIGEYFEAEGQDRFGKTSAFELIKELAEQAETGNLRYVMHPETQEHLSLEDYILNVFSQHQQDIGGKPINERFRFLPELEAACSRIADEIRDNALDPMALVSLVGNRTVLDSKLRVADVEVIDTEINRIWRAIEKAQDIDADEFISETAFATPEEFKEILEQLPETQKPFFASLFPVAVLKDLGGLKEKEIEELQDRGAADFADHLAEAIETLGTLTPKELQRYGLTEKEGQMMRRLSDDIDAMGVDEVMDSLKGQKLQDVKEAVRNGQGYWQSLVSGGRGREEALDLDDALDADAEVEAGKEDAEKSFASRFGRRGDAEEHRR